MKGLFLAAMVERMHDGSLQAAAKCDQIWRNFLSLVKFKTLRAILLRVYLTFGKILDLFWQNFNVAWQILML